MRAKFGFPCSRFKKTVKKVQMKGIISVELRQLLSWFYIYFAEEKKGDFFYPHFSLFMVIINAFYSKITLNFLYICKTVILLNLKRIFT